MIKTLKLRIKDKHIPLLIAMSRDVNFVWNYCNELCYKHLQKTNKFFSGYDLQKYTAGAKKEGLQISSQSVQMVGHELVIRRKQFKKAKLRWRISNGSRRSLGWIPLNSQSFSYINGQIKYAGHFFGLWDSYGLKDYIFKSGNFSEDSRGRWYINICVETSEVKSKGTESIGIDLGLKTLATLSNGKKIEMASFYRDMEPKLAMSQRAKKKKQVRNIHAKIKNKRNDALHKLSTQLVNGYGAIFIGDVSSSKLAKTNMAKSIFDAGWYKLKYMIHYKSDCAGVIYEEVNENYTTQTCSCCRVIPDSSPKGRAGLGIREWTCSSCNTTHDRDVNAAKNILRIGLDSLETGTQCKSIVE
jgi:IS605 OrfB family transposase